MTTAAHSIAHHTIHADGIFGGGLAHYDAQVLQSKQRALKRLAKELGQKLVPIAQPA